MYVQKHELEQMLTFKRVYAIRTQQHFEIHILL